MTQSRLQSNGLPLANKRKKPLDSEDFLGILGRMNETLFNANGRMVRVQGRVFKIISCKLAGRVLAQAEPLVGLADGKPRVNLVTGRSPLVMAIREQIGCGLVH